MHTDPQKGGAGDHDTGTTPVPAEQWRLDVATRDSMLGSSSAVGDRVVYADVATLMAMYDALGGEAWRTLLEILRNYTIVEGRNGGRRLGIVGWGVPWVEQQTGLGNRPARRAVNSLELAGLVTRDELPGSFGAAGRKVGLIDLSRVHTGARAEALPAVVSTGRRWPKPLAAPQADETGAETTSEQVTDVLAETSTRVLAETPTCELAKPSTRVLTETPTRSAAASGQVSSVLAETPTRLSTGPSRKIDREIDKLLGLDGEPGLLAHGLRPALQADSQDVLAKLVHRLGVGDAAAHARRLLDKQGIEADDGVSPLRYLLEAVLVDTYLANPESARAWLTGWGANIKRCALPDTELAERLVMAVVAVLGAGEYPSRLGGWFGAWSKTPLTSMYANDSLRELHGLCGELVKRRDAAEPEAVERAHPAPAAIVEDPPAPPASSPAAPDVSKLTDDVVATLWPRVVKQFPAARKWEGKPGSLVARGFLRSFLNEQPDLLADLLPAAADAAAPAVADGGGRVVQRRSA